MRFAAAALIVVLMLFAGIALAGAGHGWMLGAYGCWALTPIAGLAWLNALSQRPSKRSAVATLSLGILVCAVVGITTTSGAGENFVSYFRINGIEGRALAGVAYLNGTLASLVAWVRARER
ncbi:MAG TPA: hypothetical protein VM512_02845 [Burkholderiaceae bacterium]|nr:hypothetical protein [Burkholderiaceae bacterium]